MRVYHRTKFAAEILDQGFRDGEGTYLTASIFRGVWLADRPLDGNEGAWGEVVLAIDVPDAEIEKFEWVEDGKGYREFLVPASWLNRFPVISVEIDE